MEILSFGVEFQLENCFMTHIRLKVTCFAPAVSGACSNDRCARSRDPNPLFPRSVHGIVLVSS